MADATTTTGPGPKLPRIERAQPKPAPAYVFGRPWWAELLAGALFATGAYIAVRMIKSVDADATTNTNVTE